MTPVEISVKNKEVFQIYFWHFKDISIDPNINVNWVIELECPLKLNLDIPYLLTDKSLQLIT